jgi:aspartate-semialdehyde dehydrogenase
MSSGSGGLRVAVVGATGLVGETLLRVLEERRLPVAEMVPIASERSEGRPVSFGQRTWSARPADPEAFAGIDLVFFAATGALSRTLAPLAREAGALVVDKSSTWRLAPDVPLVVPEVNSGALEGHRGLVACPNCTTIGLVMALEPLRRAAGLERVVVTSLQAASGVGRAGLEALEGGAEAFPRTLAGNVVPQCDEFVSAGTTGEEAKLEAETRKILALPELPVTATCVRVPVRVGHSAAVLVETERPLPVEAAREALRAFPGVVLAEGDDYATALEVAGHDEVHVGRVRAAGGRRLALWIVSDNLRKGAATNAVQIAERLLT